MRQITLVTTLYTLLLIPTPQTSAQTKPPLRQKALATLDKAVTYYRTKVATHGGYVYYYSLDLTQRWGEGVATIDQIWVQPPGTPTVGLAFLKAHRATGNKKYLEYATEAANALIYGQLKSGAWTNCIDFNPRGKRVSLYRNGKGRGRNFSTLDDGVSQAAIRLLMHVDQAHKFQNKTVHEATIFALKTLLDTQFPNGGFPQGWRGPVPRKPIVKASYPPYDWRTEGKIREYWDMYTLNDSVAGTVSEMLIDAFAIYKDQKYKKALAKLGDFLILAQMPDPQPAWAQQYNDKMQPIWARRFEPAAISGGESQDVIKTLMKVYRATGDKKYLAPIPRALAYLKKSLLKNGQLARYYELKSNRPLYMKRNGKNYTLTYDDSQLPKHYGWKVESHLTQLKKEFESIEGPPGRRVLPAVAKLGKTLATMEKQVQTAIADLDDQGRWITTHDGSRLVGQPRFAEGYRYISSAMFSENVELLSSYLALTD